MGDVRIGIIGGTGLYEIDGLENIEEQYVDTPFGSPSDAIITGELCGKKIAFLARHGRGHSVMPTEIPARANIYALKKLGVEWLISLSAVGSLKEELVPRSIVLPDQIIDRTKSRVNSFFGNGLVVHAGFAEPFCEDLRQLIYSFKDLAEYGMQYGGTSVCMEGPLFSTKAESHLYRSWGASIIGMTILPEAKLAHEAEMCYASVSFVTDYDCWREEEEAVDVAMVIEHLKYNAGTAKQLVKKIVGKLPDTRTCSCKNALAAAILTPKDKIPSDTLDSVKLLVEKYL